MKRLLSVALLFLLFVTPAAANGWGLKGDLLRAVMANDTWDNYYAMGDQIGNVAAMTSRYHNALMLVMGKDAPLQVYTRALWQPDDDRGGARLKRAENGFTLSWRETGEEFRFELRDGEYLLVEAYAGDLHMTLRESDSGYYNVTSGSSATTWYSCYGGITLDRFSVRLFPRTMEELARLRLMRRVLDSGTDCLGWYEDPMHPGVLYSGRGKGNVPVYGAPSAKAWRASSGKAAVSLKGDVWLLRQWVAEDGSVWLHIRYEVSQRTHRFGFVQASEFPGYSVRDSGLNADVSVPVRTAVPTPLTDDPLCSQYVQVTLPAGTELECFGMFGDEYALVRTAIGGKEAWLFAPLKDLEPVKGEILTDVMAQLDGCWEYWAGGSMSLDYLRLNADGTFYNPAWPAQGGTWYVTAYNPDWNLYWDNPPYEITLLYSDGAATVCGLSLHQEEDYDGNLRDAFSLTNWEGGGGYIRIDEDSVPAWDSEDGNG